MHLKMIQHSSYLTLSFLTHSHILFHTTNTTLLKGTAANKCLAERGIVTKEQVFGQTET